MVGKLLLLLLLPAFAQAQRDGRVDIAKDFDFTFYTMHYGDKRLEMLLPRRIKKEGDRLYIGSLNSTSSVQEYKLNFVGMQADKLTELIYVTGDSIKITISPLYGWLRVGSIDYY